MLEILQLPFFHEILQISEDDTQDEFMQQNQTQTQEEEEDDEVILS